MLSCQALRPCEVQEADKEMEMEDCDFREKEIAVAEVVPCTACCCRCCLPRVVPAAAGGGCFNRAVGVGSLKVMAKMGISTVASYKAPQIFEVSCVVYLQRLQRLRLDAQERSDQQRSVDGSKGLASSVYRSLWFTTSLSIQHSCVDGSMLNPATSCFSSSSFLRGTSPLKRSRTRMYMNNMQCDFDHYETASHCMQLLW